LLEEHDDGSNWWLVSVSSRETVEFLYFLELINDSLSYAKFGRFAGSSVKIYTKVLTNKGEYFFYITLRRNYFLSFLISIVL
jgi:hypothetical protein